MTANKGLHIVRLGATLALLVIGIVYTYLNRSTLAELAKLDFGELVVLTLCVFTFFIFTGYTFYLLVSMLSVKLSLIEWLGLTFLTNAMNYLGPIRPGVVAKAAYLKQQKKMPYSRFSSILAANGFLLFLYSGITGLVLLFFTWLVKGIISYLLILICVMLIVGALVPFVVRVSRIEYQGRIWNMINIAIEGFGEIRTRRGKILAVGVSVIAQYFLSAFCSLVAYHALGFEMDFLTALLLGVFASISNFFTITPNNVGVQEIVMAYLYTITGLDFTNGLLGAGLIRAVHIALTFGLTPIFTYLMLKSANLSLAAILPGKENQPDPLTANGLPRDL